MCWWRRSGESFLQGELQEKSCRESLSEALGGLGGVGGYGLDKEIERVLRDYYGLIRSTKEAQWCQLKENA